MSELFEKAQPGIVIALCGNKVDLEDRQVTQEEANKYAESVGSFYIEVSAKANLNIDKLFDEIANRLPKTNTKENGIKVDIEVKPVTRPCSC